MENVNRRAKRTLRDIKENHLCQLRYAKWFDLLKLAAITLLTPRINSLSVTVALEQELPAARWKRLEETKARMMKYSFRSHYIEKGLSTGCFKYYGMDFTWNEWNLRIPNIIRSSRTVVGVGDQSRVESGVFSGFVSAD
ncbi:hypothetical protein Sjap_015063 [Stephania japonica]|uniref:Uncharacterized protein n=1 Tax=Stephania japonica TaxID=461633 RepID=A0AAP0IK11_9MAGN